LLFDRAVDAGARALGMPVGGLQVGRRADFVVLDSDHPRLCGHGPETVLDAFVFSRGGGSLVREVYTAGRRVVEHGRHLLRGEIESNYRRVVAGLLG
jgi:formimidoylglutamate deiminase